jgi:hypothetical protein
MGAYVRLEQARALKPVLQEHSDNGPKMTWLITISRNWLNRLREKTAADQERRWEIEQQRRRASLEKEQGK